jgi:hypothetical protein
VVPPYYRQYAWHSPLKASEGRTNVILADANHWGQDGFVGVPHTQRGAVAQNNSSFFYGPSGRTPSSWGAQGGNVGALDGSVVWKRMNQMRINQASSYIYYWGNW